MNWTPILIGIAIICYTFAARTLILSSVNLYIMAANPNYRSWDNTSTVSRDLSIGIAIATIGTVALCYL
ncbi:hypothetical protein PG2048B_0762 [Bifidobacterium pseudolongum subsp. globosum]|uniref:hypothetical protein n=1 Tax=Bifidobacterium pseudolongum TaxID=1694 RepID=UPI001022352D|nr:hypothetical protein [Bifidobacterium pseudolongum]RYQ24460.1 hypothetical protein PG2048B_0762 [Bifidobacterium pseudolongum subsp. globosum]